MAVSPQGVVFLIAYAYFVWRDDSEKVAAKDVQPDDRRVNGEDGQVTG